MKKSDLFRNRPKGLKIDVFAYLKRIGQEHKKPCLSYLRSLHKAHLLSIPFENLDIYYGNKIILKYDRIFKKVVIHGRGGFCYELNGLFYHLLRCLGFNCYIISARIKSDVDGQYGKPFDHMVIVVELENEKWLVDVGIGDGIIFPIKIKVGDVQVNHTKYWRIDMDSNENLLLRVSGDTQHFETKYLFTTKKQQIIQFLEMCEYYQISRDSSFTNEKLITQLTSTGRVTMTDRILKVTELGETRIEDIPNEDEFLSKLKHHFGISYQQLIPNQDNY